MVSLTSRWDHPITPHMTPEFDRTAGTEIRLGMIRPVQIDVVPTNTYGTEATAHERDGHAGS